MLSCSSWSLRFFSDIGNSCEKQICKRGITLYSLFNPFIAHLLPQVLLEIRIFFSLNETDFFEMCTGLLEL